MEKKLRATLRLQNGMELEGWSFGYDKPWSAIRKV